MDRWSNYYALIRTMEKVIPGASDLLFCCISTNTTNVYVFTKRHAFVRNEACPRPAARERLYWWIRRCPRLRKGFHAHMLALSERTGATPVLLSRKRAERVSRVGPRSRRTNSHVCDRVRARAPARSHAPAHVRTNPSQHTRAPNPPRARPHTPTHSPRAQHCQDLLRRFATLKETLPAEMQARARPSRPPPFTSAAVSTLMESLETAAMSNPRNALKDTLPALMRACAAVPPPPPSLPSALSRIARVSIARRSIGPARAARAPRPCRRRASGDGPALPPAREPTRTSRRNGPGRGPARPGPVASPKSARSGPARPAPPGRTRPSPSRAS